MADATQEETATRTKTKTTNIFRTGIKTDDVVKGYDDWADTYDEIIGGGMYNAPDIVLQEILKQVAPALRSATRVLDVAAGTGRVGKDLYKEGFRRIDAVEPSEGMLRKLQACGAYERQFMECVGDGAESSVPNDCYDLVVIAGGMGEGHIPVSGLDDFVRFAKKGGLVVIAMRLEFLQSVEAYKDKLEPYMEELEKKGAWIKVERRVVPNYYFDQDGVVFVYKVA